MRTFLTALTITLLLSGHVKAQLPNSGFENIVYQAVLEDTLPFPQGWQYSEFGTVSITDAYSGNYAAELWTWYCYVKGHLLATAPVTFTPTQLTGYYKYEPGSTDMQDSGLVEIKVWASGSEVGSGTGYFPETHGYTPFAVPIEMTGIVMPDSVTVHFMSTTAMGHCNISSDCNCFYLAIDELALTSLSGTVSFNELLKPVYPNPSNGLFIISHPVMNQTGSISLLDLSGRTIVNTIVPGTSKTIIDLSENGNGVYLYKIYNDKNEIIGNGKLVLNH